MPSPCSLQIDTTSVPRLQTVITEVSFDLSLDDAHHAGGEPIITLANFFPPLAATSPSSSAPLNIPTLEDDAVQSMLIPASPPLPTNTLVGTSSALQPTSATSIANLQPTPSPAPTRPSSSGSSSIIRPEITPATEHQQATPTAVVVTKTTSASPALDAPSSEDKSTPPPSPAVRTMGLFFIICGLVLIGFITRAIVIRRRKRKKKIMVKTRADAVDLERNIKFNSPQKEFPSAAVDNVNNVNGHVNQEDSSTIPSSPRRSGRTTDVHFPKKISYPLRLLPHHHRHHHEQQTSPYPFTPRPRPLPPGIPPERIIPVSHPLRMKESKIQRGIGRQDSLSLPRRRPIIRPSLLPRGPPPFAPAPRSRIATTTATASASSSRPESTNCSFDSLVTSYPCMGRKPSKAKEPEKIEQVTTVTAAGVEVGHHLSPISEAPSNPQQRKRFDESKIVGGKNL